VKWPFKTCVSATGLIAGPPVSLLLAAFSRTTQHSTLAVPCVLSNAPAECEVVHMNGCQENGRTCIRDVHG